MVSVQILKLHACSKTRAENDQNGGRGCCEGKIVKRTDNMPCFH